MNVLPSADSSCQGSKEIKSLTKNVRHCINEQKEGYENEKKTCSCILY
jgi:hypothetical protein